MLEMISCAAVEEMVERRFRLAILTNILSPYRHALYARLAERFDLAVFLSGREPNRFFWDDPALVRCPYTWKRSWGFTIPVRTGANQYDLRWLHINPGLISDLFRYRPHAVITGEMGFRTAAALLYSAACRIPLWVWWGGTLHTEAHRSGIKVLWRRWLVQRNVRWISYGASSTQYLEHLGVSRGKIVEAQNCVDERLFREAVPPLLQLGQRPVALYVGQLIGRKGVRELLDAAARAHRAGHRFTLLLVGDGPLRDHLKAYAAALGLESVIFHPPVAYQQMPAVYRSADFLVFPTLEDVWGLVVNEALWSGIPVIASIYAGCSFELVPPRNRFDPLNPRDFDTVFQGALKGEIEPPDTTRLRTLEEVTNLIADDILRCLYERYQRYELRT